MMTTTFERPLVRVEPTPPQTAAPIPIKHGRMWPRYLAVGLLTGAVGLAAGFGMGYASRRAEVSSLTTATSATTRNAVAPLAQNTPHDVAARTGVAAAASYDYGLVREHLAQAPGGWAGWLADYDYSQAREHLAQQP
jgi:hypothetical protein